METVTDLLWILVLFLLFVSFLNAYRLAKLTDLLKTKRTIERLGDNFTMTLALMYQEDPEKANLIYEDYCKFIKNALEEVL